MGTGKSKAGGRGGGANARAGESKLPTLSENIMGMPRDYYNMFNSEEARGTNDVRFTGDMYEDPALKYAVNGSWEVLSTDSNGRLIRDVQTGTITGYRKRLIGIQKIDNSTYQMTDIRTGRNMGQVGSEFQVYDRLLEHIESIAKNEITRNIARVYEEQFNETKRRTRR